MKKRLMLLSMLALVSMSGVSCDSGSNALKPKEGDVIYNSKLVFDKSDETVRNVSVKLQGEGKVKDVRVSRYQAQEGEYSYSDGVLTLASSFLSKLPVQEGTINVELDNGQRNRVDCIIATKVITTAEEFQNINENLDGIYVLGNDIDLSTISNFEPLGWYIEETSKENKYFHGILEGNGYTVKNANVAYCNTNTTNQSVYLGTGNFQMDAHKQGDNIGLFQVIGSSGVVRNVTFDNIDVVGRTIVGVVAGNCMGLIENCVVTNTCSVKGGTHFYDDDCNIAAVVGIVAGSGNIKNTLSYCTDVTFPDVYTDYDDTYIGKVGNGWDHVADPNNTDPTWKYANVDRPKMNYASGTAQDTGAKAIDSNGSYSNGIYAFAGKTWGNVQDCYSLSWRQIPYEGSVRDVYFSQTHKGENKPGSGETDLGTLINCSALSVNDLKTAALYDTYSRDIWNIEDGKLPSLKAPFITSEIVQ